MWDQLLDNIRADDLARHLPRCSGRASQPRAPQPVSAGSPEAVRVPVGAAAGAGGARPMNLRENRPDSAAVPAAKVNGKKVGRNDPCYCGSGKKFKRCHGIGA